MNLIRFFIATVLIISPGQSHALFMPDEFQVGTDTEQIFDDSNC